MKLDMLLRRNYYDRNRYIKMLKALGLDSSLDFTPSLPFTCVPRGGKLFLLNFLVFFRGKCFHGEGERRKLESHYMEGRRRARGSGESGWLLIQIHIAGGTNKYVGTK